MATREASSVVKQPVVVCTSPDVCRKGTRNVSYFIVALETDNASPSTDVFFRGGQASNLGSRLSTVYGNEPGDRGVKSGVVRGACRPKDDLSATVHVNGRPTVRESTVWLMNCNGPDGTPNTEGKLVYLNDSPLTHVNPDGTFSASTNPELERPMAAALPEGATWEPAPKAVAQASAAPAVKPLPELQGSWLGRFGGRLYDNAAGLVKSTVLIGGTVVELGVNVVQNAAGLPLSDIVGPTWRAEANEAMKASGDAMQKVIESPIDTASAFVGELASGQPEAAADLVFAAVPAGKVLRGAKSGGQGAKAGAAAQGAPPRAAAADAPAQPAVAGPGAGSDGVQVHPRKDAPSAAKKKHAEEVFDEADVLPDQRWNGPAYRGDQRSPAEIKAAGGFRGSDGKISLDEHMMAKRPPSQWVSTSRDADVAGQYALMPNAKLPEWATGGPPPANGQVLGYRYVIDHPGGVDVNSVPGIMNTSNLEVAYSRGIPWSATRGWTTYIWQDGRVVEMFTPN